MKLESILKIVLLTIKTIEVRILGFELWTWCLFVSSFLKKNAQTFIYNEYYCYCSSHSSQFDFFNKYGRMVWVDGIQWKRIVRNEILDSCNDGLLVHGIYFLYSLWHEKWSNESFYQNSIRLIKTKECRMVKVKDNTC